MKHFLVRLLSGLAVAACIRESLLAGTSDIYVNRSVISSSRLPAVDAKAFVNLGTFGSGAILNFVPYRTMNTVNFTNRGSMAYFPGFEFKNFPSVGDGVPANSFYNAQGATITGVGSIENAIAIATTTPDIFPDWARSEAYGDIVINATNVVNGGQLLGAAGGEVRILGDTLNLSSGTIDISPRRFGTRSQDLTAGTVIPEAGFQDIAWGYASVPTGFNLTPIVTDTGGGTVTNATLDVGGAFPIQLSPRMVGGGAFTVPGPTIENAQVFMRYRADNDLTPTNMTYDLVFVTVPDPNIAVDVGFSRVTGQAIDNPFRASYVRFTASSINPLNGQTETARLFVADRSAVLPTSTLLRSEVNSDEFQARDLYLGGSPPEEFPGTGNGNWGPFTSDMFNTVHDSLGDWPIDGTPFLTVASSVSGGYLKYLQGNVAVPLLPDLLTGFDSPDFPLGAFDSQITAFGSPLPGANYTNYGGRVMIEGNSVDLARSKIRAQGPLSVIAKEYSPGSRSMIVDAAIYSLNLANSTSPLIVTNLVHPKTSRLGGGYYLHSFVVRSTATRGDSTTINVNFHITVVETSFTLERSTIAAEATLQSTNVFLGDVVPLVGKLRTTAESFTIGADGGLSYLNASPNPDFTASEFPKLLNLTNAGSISTLGRVVFGSDRVSPYLPLKSLVNTGSIRSGSVEFNSDSIVNEGTITANSGVLEINSDGVFNQNAGSITGQHDAFITAATFNLAGGTVAADTLTLSSTKELNGTGGAISVVYGLSLPQLPPKADLSGVSVTMTPPALAFSDFVWSGKDLGPSAAGFVNNAAIGNLDLNGGLNSLTTLSGIAGETNALYVKTLVISQTLLDTVGSLLPGLVIADGFRVYFGQAMTDSGVSADDVLLTSPTLAGKMIKVPGVSAVSPMLDTVDGTGKAIKVSWALRNSAVIDSDGDGIANLFDSSPFDPIVVSSVQIVGKPAKFAIRWTGAAGKSYRVEYNSGLGASDWALLTTVKNESSAPAKLEAKDPILDSTKMRTYRVVYTP